MRDTLTALLLMVPVLLHSQVPELVTDRPDKTESAVAVPKGSLQIESGMSFEDHRVGPERLQTLALPSTLFRLAIVKGLELRVGTGVTCAFHNVDLLPEPTGTMTWGFDDLSFGTKVQIVNRAIQVAIIAEAGVPSGSGSQEESVDVRGLLCVSHDVTPRVSFGYNAGASSGDRMLLGSFSAAAAVGERAGVFGEFYGGYMLPVITGQHATHPFALDCGLTYLLCPNLQLDVSFGTAITQRRNFYSAGLSWRILGKSPNRT